MKIGIIGGSGLYGIDGFKDPKWVKVDTPFGSPSDEYLTGKLQGRELVFLPRHGRGHSIMPTDLNFRANIFGLKALGVDAIISATAVGSLKEELKPLDIVIPDQFVDRTNQARRTTFFGDGAVAHIAFANPVCECITDDLYKAAGEVGSTVHKGGTYLNMEGPAFSTKAESELYRSWGMDIIGMTNMAEARLAREAEICYATMAMITDYDCWHEGEENVTIEMIIQNLMKNVEAAKKIITKVTPKIKDDRTCNCREALKNAIITRPEAIPAKTKKKLKVIIGKYLKDDK